LCVCVQMYGLINEKCTTIWAGYYVHKYELVTILFKLRKKWHFDGCILRCANANLISRWRRKQKIRDLRHLTFQVSVMRKIFANFTGLYFLHFTTFSNQSLQF
jgi:hypothetical protein